MAVAMRTATKEQSEHELRAVAHPFPRDRAARLAVLRDEHGQAFGEYALILALVVIVAAAALSPFGVGLATYIGNTFGAVMAAL